MDEAIIPLVMQGESGMDLAVVGARRFVDTFESDGGAKLDDEHMEVVEHILTSCMTIIALAADSAEDKVDHVDDILKVWKAHRSSTRSPLSLLATSLAECDWWHPHLSIITENPVGWKTEGPLLQESMEAVRNV